MLQIEEDERRLNIPKVNVRAAGAVDEKDEASLPVFERLTQLTNKQRLASMLSQVKDELEMAECTFQPSISSSEVGR